MTEQRDTSIVRRSSDAAVFLDGLRQLRGDLSLTHVGKLMGCSASHLYRSLNPEQGLPTLDFVTRYSTTLGVDPKPWRQRWHWLQPTAPPLPEQSATRQLSMHPQMGSTNSAAQDRHESGPASSTAFHTDASSPTAPLGNRHHLLLATAAIATTAAVAVALTNLLSGNARPAPVSVKPPRPARSDPACLTESCRGVDPKVSGCGVDAITIGDDWRSSLHVEVRYSPRCKAVWGKVTGAQTGDRLEIATSPKSRQKATVRTGHTKYTSMLPAVGAFSAHSTAVSVDGNIEAMIPPGYALRVSVGHHNIPSASKSQRPAIPRLRRHRP